MKLDIITRNKILAQARDSADGLIVEKNLHAGDNTIIIPDSVAVVKDSAGAELFSEPIKAGSSEDIFAPDSLAVLKDTAGATLSSTSIKSDESKNITAPNATAVIKDQFNNTLVTDTIKSGSSKNIAVTLPRDVFTKVNFAEGHSEIEIEIDADSVGTYTVELQDGASGDITYAVDTGSGYGSFASFVNPTTYSVIGHKVKVHRTVITAEGWVKITGTY